MPLKFNIEVHKNANEMHRPTNTINLVRQKNVDVQLFKASGEAQPSEHLLKEYKCYDIMDNDESTENWISFNHNF